MIKTLRHLKVAKGVTRLAAADVRHLMQTTPLKANKYKAKRVECDGYGFASIKERDTYLDLKMLLRAGDITDLELQPRFPLVVNGVKVCEYRGDFSFKERDGETKVLDVKGVKTQAYVIKRKLMAAVLGVDVIEV